MMNIEDDTLTALAHIILMGAPDWAMQLYLRSIAFKADSDLATAAIRQEADEPVVDIWWISSN